MPSVTKRLSALHWDTGLAGTLAYTVRSASGTHVARTTSGVTAGSVSGRRYYADVAVDPTWPSGTEIFWDDGTDEARGPVDVREVMPGATKRFSVDWEVSGASLYYTVSGPTGTIVARTNTGVTAGGVSGKTYHVDLAVESSWIGAEIVWDDGTDEQSEPISGGQTIDVNLTAWLGETVAAANAGYPPSNVKAWDGNDVYVDDGGGKPVVYVEGIDANAANAGPLADINTSLAALPTAAEIAAQVGETIVGNGSGDTAVDHDGATGVTVDGEPSEADVMRFTLPGGGGADGVEVVAYLTADYDAGNRGTANRQGTTSTGSDGRWVAPLMLDTGTYTILGNRGGYVVAAVTVVVP